MCDPGPTAGIAAPYIGGSLWGIQICRPQGPSSSCARGASPVHLRITETVLAFWMPYTNPDHDVDVSGQVHHNGAVGTGNTQIVHHHLQVSPHCKTLCCLCTC